MPGTMNAEFDSYKWPLLQTFAGQPFRRWLTTLDDFRNWLIHAA
jgi:hypothetical protein